MNSKKILFLYPSEGIRMMLEQHLENIDQHSIQFYFESETDFKERQEMINYILEFDSVVAQGSLYQTLLSLCPSRCFEIEITSLDILTVAQLAITQKAKTVLLCSTSIAQKASNLFNILEISIDISSATDSTPEKTVAHYLASGYQLFITDSDYSQICKKAGIQPIMLTSGYNSVIKTLINALSYLQHAQKAHLSMAVLDQYYADSDRCCLIFDEHYKLLDAFRQHAPKNLLRAIMPYLPTLDQEKEIQRICTIHSQSYLMKGSKIYLGEQFFFVCEVKKSFDNSKTSIPGITIKNTTSINKDFYNAFYDDLQNPIFRDKTIAYSQAQTPVIIIGESGTGKSRLADFIFHHGEYHDNLFYLVDCKQLDKRGLQFMFNSINSPLYENRITLYFKEINLMKPKYLHELIDFLEQSIFIKNNKLIFSVTCRINESYNNKLCELLTSKLGSFPLFLIPLRDRKQLIPGLAVLYLNRLNETSLKQIVGIEPEAMDYLQGFSWNDNVKQFKRVLHELHTIAATTHITKQDMIPILKEESTRISTIEPNTEQSRQGLTLDQIIKNAVKDAMIENKMNQTRAAKQLGIGRTTLWRILSRESDTNS